MGTNRLFYGSNIFNFLVLAFSDIFVKNDHIYKYADVYSYSYLFGGLFITVLLLKVITDKNKCKLFYLLLSLIMSLSYLLVWYFQFK